MRTHLGSRLSTLLSAAVLSVGLIVGLPAVAQAGTWPVPTRDQPLPAATDGPLSTDDFEIALMMTINEERVAHGQSPIALFDECTDRLAERWGRHISRTGVFAHRDQNRVIRRCDTSWAGEALVRGAQLTPGSMVDLWMDSPPHREILLSPRARYAGVAVVPDAEGRLVGVLNLTRR